MKRVNHPLFGQLGAFWIPPVNHPFYSLKDAEIHQYKKGGDILGPDGRVLYPDTEPDCPVCTNCQERMHFESPLLEGESLPCPSCGYGETIRSTTRAEMMKMTPSGKKTSWWSSIFKGPT